MRHARGREVAGGRMGILTTRERRALVIVVDDEPTVCDLVCESLFSLDLEIETHTDPHLALESIISRRPQIAIVDLHMPRMSGMELLEKVVSFDAGIEVFL